MVLSKQETECRDVHDMVPIMIPIMVVYQRYKMDRGPYSKLEIICSKRKNQLSTDSMEKLFFMAILNLPLKDAPHDKHEFL